MPWVLVPIILTVTIGFVWVTAIYFRSREKQMMIEKGMSYEQMVEFMKTKRDKFILMKIGIIISSFGIALAIGDWINPLGGEGAIVGASLFFFTGLGFVAANLICEKMRKNEDENKNAGN